MCIALIASIKRLLFVTATYFRATGTFISCVQTVPIPSSDMCSEEHLWNATDEYSWYITENIGGSADLCRGI